MDNPHATDLGPRRWLGVVVLVVLTLLAVGRSALGTRAVQTVIKRGYRLDVSPQ